MDDEENNFDQDAFLLSRRRVVRYDNKLFIVFNIDPSLLTTSDDRLPIVIHDKIRLPPEASNSRPYLCTIPADHKYAGAVLKVIRLAGQSSIKEEKDRHILDPAIASRWILLENVLTSLAHAFLRHTNPPYVPLDYKFPPSPRTRQYSASYGNRKEACGALQSSKAAFRLLIAHVAWAAIGHRKSYRAKNPLTNSANVNKGWSNLLRKEYQVHEAWVNDLAISDACDFYIRRVGVTLYNPTDWQYADWVFDLIEANVPVWIFWNEGESTSPQFSWSQEVVQIIGPSRRELQCIHDQTPAFHIGDSASHPLAPPSHPSAPPSHLHELSESKCRNDQHSKGGFEQTTDIFDWIKKQEDLISKVTALATEEQKQRWLERHIQSLSMACPERGGALVYVWGRDSSGNLVRSRASRSKVGHIWRMFDDKQRWFNKTTNEWDLCAELDRPNKWNEDAIYPENKSHINDDSYSEVDFDFLNIDEELPSNADNVSAFVRPADNELTRISDSVLNIRDELDIVGLCKDAHRFISVRFGFAYDKNSTYSTSMKKPMKMQKALRIIGDRIADSAFVMREGYEASFVQFVMSLDDIGHPDIDNASIPEVLCDLHPGNSRSLQNTASSIYIQEVFTSERPLFFIHHKSEKPTGWQLAVVDPCTALQAVRLNPSSISELTREFVHSRTPFLTLKYDSSSPHSDSDSHAPLKPTTHVPMRFGLGERPPGHKLDKEDFVAYEGVRDRLLGNERIARAAIKRGGLLSRLASTVVDEYDVLDGPSLLALENPLRYTIEVEGEKRHMIDDGLTVEEIAILVGLYSIPSTSCTNTHVHILTLEL